MIAAFGAALRDKLDAVYEQVVAGLLNATADAVLSEPASASSSSKL